MAHTTQHTTQPTLKPVQYSSFSGLLNLIKKEMNSWLKTKLWKTQLLIWSVIIPTFITLAVMAELDAMIEEGGIPFLATISQITSNLRAQTIISLELNLFFVLGTLLISIGIPILLMNSILGEQDNGSIEWVLSNPVQRKTIIIAKLISQTLLVNLFLVLLPTSVIYVIIFVLTGVMMPLQPYSMAVGIMMLYSTFSISLTYLIQVITKSRGIILGALITFSIFGGDIPVIKFLSPSIFGNVELMVSIGHALPASVPLVAVFGITFLLIIACAAVSIFIFNQEEF